MLKCAALTGMAMRPEEVEKLMRAMHQPTLAHVSPEAEDQGDDPLEPDMFI